MSRPKKQAQLRPCIEPDQRSDTAVRHILIHLLDTLQANIDAVLEDLDPKPLHDLRVAARRTRSALSAFKSVLPDAVVAEFVLGFKWLGSVTGPCRDLDVQLIEMGVFQKRLEISDGSLGPLRRLLEELRREEHLRVCESLKSERFRNLIGGWDKALNSETGIELEPDNTRRPVIGLARKKIHQAYRRFVKRGARLADDAPEKAFHRLRIDAKKLRYLIEFFSVLYPEETIRLLVKDLKRLQDTLGGFNDMVVQRARFADLTDRITESGEASPATVIAMGHLADAMAERQDEQRHAFADRFASFASAENRLLYQKTFT